MFFFGKNKFSWPNGQLSPTACHTYILKAIVPAVDFSYLNTLFEHPTRRPNFVNTLQPH